MQPSKLQYDLQSIVDSIDIDGDGLIFYKGQIYGDSGPSEIPVDNRVFQNLYSLVYSSFYTRGSVQTVEDKNLTEGNDYFLQTLRSANSSVESYNGGWTVEEIESSGKILVRKGGYKRYTYAGDFIREHFGQGPLQRQESINIRVLPEYTGPEDNSDVFYFVFSDTLLENNNAAIIRFYFNVRSDSAPLLIKWVTKNLNRYNVPFQFKCLNQSELYTRCDSAVLYTDKRYSRIVSDLLAEFYHTIKNWLNDDVPMFTLVLAPGIGFGENPISSAESFGTTRCKIVAQGLLTAWKAHQQKNSWVDTIVNSFRKNFLNPEALHLNPNSKFPYHFPSIEN